MQSSTSNLSSFNLSEQVFLMFHLWFCQIKFSWHIFNFSIYQVKYFKYFIYQFIKLGCLCWINNKCRTLSLSFALAGTWWNQETTKLPRPWGNFMLSLATSGRAFHWFVHLCYHFLHYWLFSLPSAIPGPHPHFFHSMPQCHDSKMQLTATHIYEL